MRQVPKVQYAIVGHGRMARHFCHYLSLLNIAFRHWSRSDKIALADVIGPCSTVLLLISDSAIESFIRENNCLAEKQCVHFSGSLISDLAHGAHPLMTFGPELYSLSEYQEIPWIVESTAPSFSELLPGLSNSFFVIDKNKKDFYHALCVMSNNFTTLLWQKFFNDMTKTFNIPKPQLIPIFKRTMKNILENHDMALTGPLARGDHITINQNLHALHNDAFLEVYQAFFNTYKQEHP